MRYLHLCWAVPAATAVAIWWVVSVLANYQSGLAFGSEIFGYASVASDVMKAAIPFGVAALLIKGYRMAGASLAVMWLACTLWSLSSAMGFVSLHNRSMTDSRGQSVEAYTMLRDQIARLEDRRAKTEAVRPESVISSEIASLLRTPGAGGCTVINGPVTARICPQVDALTKELGHAKSASWLDGRLDELRQEMTSITKVSSVDPRNEIAASIMGVGTAAFTEKLAIFFAVMMELVTAIGFWAVWRAFAGTFWKPSAAPRAFAPAIIPRQAYTPSLTLPRKPEQRVQAAVPETPAPTPEPDGPGTPVTEPETKPDDTPETKDNVVTLYEPPVNPREERRRKKEIIDRQNRALVSAYVDECLDTEAPEAQIVLTAKGGHLSGGTAGDAIYTDFRRWCRDNGESPVGRNHYGRFIGEFVDRARNSKGVVYGAVIRAAVAKRRVA